MKLSLIFMMWPLVMLTSGENTQKMFVKLIKVKALDFKSSSGKTYFYDRVAQDWERFPEPHVL